MVCLLALLANAGSSLAGQRYDPRPNPDSVVHVGGQARFTMLTSQLIRMEWGGNKDEPTWAFVNRNLPKPDFTVKEEDGWTVITTEKITVSFVFDIRLPHPSVIMM